MKKFFTLLFSSLFSFPLFAFDGSRLSISTINNSMNLKIELDGQPVRLQGNSITLNNLNEGSHNFRVYRGRRNTSFNNRFDPGYEIIYATSVYLTRAYGVDITINGTGKVFLDSYRIESDNEYYTGKGDGENAANESSCSSGENNGYSHVMSAGEFMQVTYQIGKEWFDANRMISVKTIIDKNNFTVKQVKDLMLLFTFENNRLEIAKYAYRKTLDKENYYRLNDAFSFSSSKDELARFIRESR